MSEQICCRACEGWGVTAYLPDGTGVPCERCKGTGKVDPPAPPVRVPDERDRLIAMAEDLKDSQLSDVAQLAQAVIDYLEADDE